MSLNVTDPAALTTNSSALSRTKYFPLELKVVGVKPLTNFNALYNGANVNAFCKQFGKGLGAQLTSDKAGTILFQFHVAVPYNQTYLVNTNKVVTSNTVASLATNSSTLKLQDPTGAVISTFLPFNLKM